MLVAHEVICYDPANIYYKAKAKESSMQLLKYIPAVIAAAPMMACAASQINAEQVTCSGTQTTDTTNGLQIDCLGSLTIFGGRLISDEDIKLTASDALYLDLITVRTPKNISLTGNSVSLGNNAKLDGYQVTVNSKMDCANAGVIVGELDCNTNIVNSGVIVGGIRTPGTINGVISLNPGFTNGGNNGAAGGAISFDSTGSTNGGNIIARGTTNGGIVSSTNGASAGSGFWIFNPPGVDLSGSTCQPTGAPSVFKLIEDGTRYCASGKTRFHQVRFIRTTAECRTLPTSFEMAATSDFPPADTTLRSAQCTDDAGLNSSCLIYDAVDGSGNPIQPSAGRLDLKWNKNGALQKLEGRIIEKTADDCYSESSLKFVKGKK